MNKGRKSSIGERRNLLTIQRAIETQAADGAVVQAWVEVRQAMGDVQAVTATESYVAQGTAGQIQYSTRIDYSDGIEPSMRVTWGSRVFDITGVEPVHGRRQQLELLCTERV